MAIYLFSAASDGATGTELWVTDGASDFRLLKDINPGSAASEPMGLTELANGRMLFTADDGVHGRELWVTDGTEDGTVMLQDALPGAGGAGALYLTALGNGRALFTASDGTHGTEVWVTDGTAAGTVMLKDIAPGSMPSYPGAITAIGNGRAMFTTNTAAAGTELWITDGTAAGTTAVKDIRAGVGGSDPTNLVALVDGRVLFSADDGTHGAELWASDGTAGGTVMLKDINPSGGSAPGSFAAAADGRILFAADDGSNGTELWITDGTAAGTTLVMDVNPGSGGSAVSNVTYLGNGSFAFVADDGVNGRELWITDGTADGTAMLDLDPALSANPTSITPIGGGKFMFCAGTKTSGRELWVFDGTEALQVADINPGNGNSSPYAFTVANFPIDNASVAAFTVSGSDGLLRLWLSSGDVGGAGLFGPGLLSGARNLFLQVKPSVTIRADDRTLAAGASTTVTFTLSEECWPFNLDLVTVSNGSLSDLTATGSLTYTATFTAAGTGTAAIRVAADRFADLYGQYNVASRVLTIYDDTPPPPPTIAAIAGDDMVSGAELQSGLVLTGSAEEGSRVDLTIGGQTRRAVLNGTTWTYRLRAEDLAAMGEGAQTVSVTARDGMGRFSTAATRDFTIDTGIGSTAMDPLAPINAARKAAGVTLTGTAEAGSTVTLDLIGLERTATLVGTNWTYALTEADFAHLGEGTIYVGVTAADAAGNTATARSGRVVIDTQAPTAPSFQAVTADNRISRLERDSGTVTLSGRTESRSRVTLSIGGATRRAVVDGMDWSYTLTRADFTALGQGTVTVTGTVTDSAGNVSSVGQRRFTIDTQPPPRPGGGALTADNILNADEASADVLVSGVTAAGTTVTVSIGEVSRTAEVTRTTWSTTLTAADCAELSQGFHTLTVTATDRAGNDATLSRKVAVDTVAGDAFIAGDSGANRLAGGRGAQTLYGGRGADTLSGGGGADLFHYAARNEGRDTITDFRTGTDKIVIDGLGFGWQASSPVVRANAGGVASGAGAQLVFNTSNGALSFDADGVGAKAAVHIATLNVRSFSSADVLLLA